MEWTSGGDTQAGENTDVKVKRLPRYKAGLAISTRIRARESNERKKKTNKWSRKGELSVLNEEFNTVETSWGSFSRKGTTISERGNRFIPNGDSEKVREARTWRGKGS